MPQATPDVASKVVVPVVGTFVIHILTAEPMLLALDVNSQGGLVPLLAAVLSRSGSLCVAPQLVGRLLPDLEVDLEECCSMYDVLKRLNLSKQRREVRFAQKREA